ncbi:MAG: CTP synthase [Conexivisphaerales archaeon]
MHLTRTKYIFVTGGVMSGLGKGATVASIAKLLLLAGYNVSCMKIDPYLNVDAGTMNPLVHGEVFVTDDGGECDMDIGTYERFLDKDLKKENNITTGQIYQRVIADERSGKYLGSCVQIIPNITDEIKKRLRLTAREEGLDFLVVECGGTVGDIESLPFLEAFRQMAFEEADDDVFFVHVTLAPILQPVGEIKTKPTQHSVQELRRIGIQPDAIVVRAEKKLTTETKKKIALFTSVPEFAVISNPDMHNIYRLPEMLFEEGILQAIEKKMNVKMHLDWGEWKGIASSFEEHERKLRVAMVGKYTALADSYVSVNHSLLHAAAKVGVDLSITWIESEEIEKEGPERLIEFDGIVLPQGFGMRGTEGKIIAANFARERNIPFLGLCFGFQLATVAFARYACGMQGANSTEIDPNTKYPVIDLLPEQRRVKEVGATMRLGGHDITIKEDSFAYKIYGKRTIRRRHRHRYEVNPDYREKIESCGLVFSAFSDGGKRAEILEYTKNKFYMATQFHPEYSSRPGRPEEMFLAFVSSML